MAKQAFQTTLVSVFGDCTAVTAAARTSLLTAGAANGLITLPNGFFDFPGKMIKITAQGRISCAVTTPGTARFDVAFNGVANFDSTTGITLGGSTGALAKTNVPWWLEIVGTCRTVGNGTLGTIFWFANLSSEALIGSQIPNTTAGGPVTILLTHGGFGATAVGATFDTTAAIPLDLRFTQTVATGSITLQQYKVEDIY